MNFKNSSDQFISLEKEKKEKKNNHRGLHLYMHKKEGRNMQNVGSRAWMLMVAEVCSEKWEPPLSASCN